MWEGCRRLNGRVSATLGQVTIKSEPISDPAQLMAHRFARAARLYPGKSVQFETGISDWLEIRRSSTYQLSARYKGLLDNQRPNVTPGWQLWRQSAVSKPVETTLLTAPDYVAKRTDFACETGLALGLSKIEIGSRSKVPSCRSLYRTVVTNNGRSLGQAHWGFGFWTPTADASHIR